MKKFIVFGVATVGGVIAFGCVSRQLRCRLTAVLQDRMIKCMEHMMASLPEGAPPKLIMSVLPKLQVQNDQIVTLLREQNELLREQRTVH